MDRVDQVPDRFPVKTHIGDGRKQPLDQETVGVLRRVRIPLGGACKPDQRAGQLILEPCHVGVLSANAEFALAAGASGCLFTLKTEHLTIHSGFLLLLSNWFHITVFAWLV